MRVHRRLAALVLFATVASACGVRLDDAQLEIAREAQLARSTEGEVTISLDGVPTTGGGGAPTTSGPAPEGGAAAPGDSSTTAPTDSGSTAPGGTATTAPSDSASTPTGGQTQAPAQPADTRAAPAGGNGGATDTGVTETKISIANVVDKSGAVPGLFEDAQLAVRARFAKFTAEEGTIFGRQIELKELDSRMDAGANKQAYQQACDTTLMSVGSMSAFDQGAAGEVTECKYPDLRTASVSAQMMDAPTAYSADTFASNKQPLSEYLYWKEQIGDGPDGVGSACYYYIDSGTTEFQTGLVKRGTEQIGYNWLLYEKIALSEGNYAAFAVRMKQEGCAFVTIQGAIDQASRLAAAMRDQDFWPKVYALQSNIYSPDYITLGGTDIEGSQLAVPSALLEEVSGNPEMQEYQTWLARVSPGAKPTGLGMYAWSSATLAIERLKDVGPDLTREKMLASLKEVRGFTGNGLIPPQDVGLKQPADCVVIVEVVSGKFKRIEPAGQGYRCDNKVVTV